MGKHAELLELARKRAATRWTGYKCIGDYHGGRYECAFVSPFTKAAGNVESEILVVLQDWASDDELSGPFDEAIATLGYAPGQPTTRNLMRLLRETFQRELSEVYGTNLFPFVKMGPTNSPIPPCDLLAAARQYALQQVRLIAPRLVICLGLATFDALSRACGLGGWDKLAPAIDSPFDYGEARVWCQAHTGHWGQVNRNKGRPGQVLRDWQGMRADFETRRVAAGHAGRPAPGPA
jgi:restriction system protein